MKLLIRYCLEIFQSSLYPPFYRSAVRQSVFRAFGYYLFFTTIYSLLIGIAGLWWTSRHWEPFINLVEQNLPQVQIGISQGHFHSTLPEPFIVGNASFTLIVDTTGARDDLSSYESAILLTQTRAFFKKSRFETRQYNLAAIPDFSLTTSDAIAWLREYKNTLLWSFFGSLGLAFLPLAWLFLIPALLLFAAILMIPAALVRARLGYAQILSIVFYAVTLPTLVQTYLLMRGATLDRWYWGIYLLWCLIAVVVARRPATEPIGNP